MYQTIATLQTVFQPLQLAAVALALIPIALAGGFAYGPISRSRVQAFAYHHKLTITTDNGDRVIRYLAVTRRWRSAGLGLTVSFGAAWAFLSGASVTLLAVFAGWFAGALAAELHLAFVRHDTKRSASLRPRRPEDYVSPIVWWLPVLSAAVGVPLMLMAGGATTWMAAALLVLGAVVLVRRRVLLRAQPAAAPDVVAADDAVRSRSIHVLSGGGFVLVSMFLLAALDGKAPGGAALAWLLVLVAGALAANARGPRRSPA
jgi:hypothetical protein